MQNAKCKMQNYVSLRGRLRPWQSPMYMAAQNQNRRKVYPGDSHNQSADWFRNDTIFRLCGLFVKCKIPCHSERSVESPTSSTASVPSSPKGKVFGDPSSAVTSSGWHSVFWHAENRNLWQFRAEGRGGFCTLGKKSGFCANLGWKKVVSVIRYVSIDMG